MAFPVRISSQFAKLPRPVTDVERLDYHAADVSPFQTYAPLLTELGVTEFDEEYNYVKPGIPSLAWCT